MPALIGPIGTVVNMNQALNGNALGNPAYASQLDVANQTGGQAAIIANYNASLASANATTLATTILNNMFVTTAAGVSAANVTALTSALSLALSSYPTAKGQVISNLANLLGGLEADASWGPAALAFNSQAAADYVYSTTLANTNAGVPSAVSTYTLTTGIDTATSKSFVGFFDNTAANTLQSGDTLTGAFGTANSLSLTLAADSSAVVPLVTNIQTLSARSTNAAAVANAGYTGLTNITNNNSIANLAFASAVGTANTINISNNTSGTAGTIVTYTNNTFASNNATVNLALSSAGSSLVSQAVEARVGGNDSVKTLNISGTGTNRITLADNAAGIDRTVTAVNLSGTGSIRIDGAANSLALVTTVNASTNTGGVNVDLASGGNAVNVAFTGGAGNDRVSFAAGTFTNGDVLIGGEGTNTLAIADKTISTSGNANLINSIKAATGFTVLELTGTATTSTALQAANTGLSNFSLTGAFTGAAGAADGAGVTAYAVTGQANTQAYTVAGTIVGGVGGAASANNNGTAGGAALSFTPTLDNGSNSLSITLNGTSLTGGAGTALAGNGTADGAGADALAATAFESITIVSQGTSANALVGGVAGGTTSTPAAGFGANVNTNATFTITGAQDLNLGTVGGSNVNISASGFTGNLTAAVTAGNQTVTSGSGNDTIFISNAGTATINTGAGNDRISIVGAGIVVKSDATLAAQVGGVAGAANHGGTFTGGAGIDTFAFTGSSLANTMTVSAGTTRGVTLSDFTTGVDKIALVNTAAAFTSITMATAQTIATASSLTEVYAGVTAIAASANGGAASAVVLTVSAGTSAGTWLYINDGTGAVSNSTDALIKIVGSTSVIATDFVFA